VRTALDHGADPVSAGLAGTAPPLGAGEVQHGAGMK